jgi:lysyl-tRNA synthetase class 2
LISPNLQRLNNRACIYKQIRAFFDALNYLEVDTPLLGISTNPDFHIQTIPAQVNHSMCYLQTSPEFSMKRLLAEGSDSIYQICHAFRDEERGRLHHAEFTLLEWYSVGFDYLALMDQLEALITLLMKQSLNIKRLSYFEVYLSMLNLNLEIDDVDKVRGCVSIYVPGINVENLDYDDCLNLLMSQVISKRFEGFTFIYDYPATQASLAKIKADNPLVAERFELFYNDMELANGFSELTNAQEQRQRFERDNAQRVLNGLMVYPIDEDFLTALESGLPECAGVALGLDRLLMVINAKSNIGEVLSLDTLS